MNFRFVGTLVFIVVIGLITSSFGKSDVIELNSSNIHSISEGEWLVEIYASWCGYCKTFAPIYEKIATKLKGKVNVGRLDGDIQQDMSVRFQITGFPTLFFIRNGEAYLYDKGRSDEEVIDFVKGGWEQEESLPFYKSPVSLVGEFLGLLGKMSVNIIQIHDFLQDKYQLSTPVLAGAGLAALFIVVVILAFATNWAIGVILDSVGRKPTPSPQATKPTPQATKPTPQATKQNSKATNKDSKQKGSVKKSQ